MEYQAVGYNSAKDISYSNTFLRVQLLLKSLPPDARAEAWGYFLHQKYFEVVNAIYNYGNVYRHNNIILALAIIKFSIINMIKGI